jgi:hypothetical protein
MSGTLAGARLGAAALPGLWLENAEAVQHVTLLADRLADLWHTR